MDQSQGTARGLTSGAAQCLIGRWKIETWGMRTPKGFRVMEYAWHTDTTALATKTKVARSGGGDSIVGSC